ncbi:MAG TPA: outer membrane beta-barrel protein [Cyclobacteriaceae bacterium]|nr:outer membrane beta-barrel protein [Cyclobacteriaceae bacterium]
MRHLYILLFISLANICFAQRFSPGYIIQKGDTIRGYVQDKDVNRSHASCTFKRDMNGTATDYKPFDIDGYGIENFKVYASRKMQVNDSTIVDGFAEFIVHGNVNFFIYKSQFFAEKDGAIKELRITRTIVYQGNEQKMLKRNEYHGVLASMMTDCPDFTPRIFETALTQNKLEVLISDYNKCVNPTNVIIYKENIPNVKLSFGLSGAYLFLNWGGNLLENEYPTYDLDALRSSSSFAAGAFIEATFPRFSKKMSLRTELLWMSAAQFNSTKTISTPTPNENLTTQIEVGFSAIKIPVLVKYNFSPGNKIEPFVNLGPTINIISEQYNQQIQTRELAGNVSTQQSSPFNYQSLTPYLTGGIGARINFTESIFVELEGRFEYGGSAINSSGPFVFYTFDQNNLIMFRAGKRLP